MNLLCFFFTQKCKLQDKIMLGGAAGGVFYTPPPKHGLVVFYAHTLATVFDTRCDETVSLVMNKQHQKAALSKAIWVFLLVVVNQVDFVAEHYS